MKFTLTPFPLVLLALPAALVAGASFSQQGSPDPDEVTELVVRLTNEFRVQEGRKEVVVNGQLLAAARYFAGYVAKTGQFSHEADGSTPGDRAKQHGYDQCIVSENIAYQYSSTGFATRQLAQGFVEGWKNSPGHRKNMLDPDVTETGAAVARSKPGHYYAVQMFGRPASQAVKFSIANRSNAALRYRIGNTAFSLAPRQTRTHQQCRSDEVTFDWPGKQPATTVSPKDGDRLAIVRTESGGFSLNRE